LDLSLAHLNSTKAAAGHCCFQKLFSSFPYRVQQSLCIARLLSGRPIIVVRPSGF
jgi:hypothetical protein